MSQVMYILKRSVIYKLVIIIGNPGSAFDWMGGAGWVVSASSNGCNT